MLSREGEKKSWGGGGGGLMIKCEALDYSGDEVRGLASDLEVIRTFWRGEIREKKMKNETWQERG